MSFEFSHTLSDPQVQAALKRAREERSQAFGRTFGLAFFWFVGLFQLPGQLRRKVLGEAERLAPYAPAPCG